MDKAIEHLEAALKILKPLCTEAQDRYDKQDAKFRKYKKSGSAAMRYAWHEYRALSDMIESISNALTNADEYSLAIAKKSA